ncbi:MAG: hypothetical protein Q9187_006022 [Circinaria calcarea]
MLIWSVKINLRRKLGLGSLLRLSIFAIITNIIRAARHKLSNGQDDVVWILFWVEVDRHHRQFHDRIPVPLRYREFSAKALTERTAPGERPRTWGNEEQEKSGCAPFGLAGSADGYVFGIKVSVKQVWWLLNKSSLIALFYLVPMGQDWF